LSIKYRQKISCSRFLLQSNSQPCFQRLHISLTRYCIIQKRKRIEEWMVRFFSSSRWKHYTQEK
jgi:hypothetical protein